MIEEFQRTNPLARGDENIKPLDVYAEHAEIRKQIYDEIKKLHNTLGDTIQLSADIIIDKFLNCLTPLKNLHDPGRLPLYTIVPRSMVYNKQYCVWVVVSCLVQAYWKYELDDIPKELIVSRLEQLKIINEHYPEMKIAGAENRGWWLEL